MKILFILINLSFSCSKEYKNISKSDNSEYNIISEIIKAWNINDPEKTEFKKKLEQYPVAENPTLNRLLYYAIKQNDLKLMSHLLDARYDTNWVMGVEHHSLLMYAISLANINMVKLLLQKNVQIIFNNKHGKEYDAIAYTMSNNFESNRLSRECKEEDFYLVMGQIFEILFRKLIPFYGTGIIDTNFIRYYNKYKNIVTSNPLIKKHIESMRPIYETHKNLFEIVQAWNINDPEKTEFKEKLEQYPVTGNPALNRLLYYAIKKNDHILIIHLLNAGYNPNWIRNDKDYSTLMFAASLANIDMVELLLDKKALVRFNIEDRTKYNDLVYTLSMKFIPNYSHCEKDSFDSNMLKILKILIINILSTKGSSMKALREVHNFCKKCKTSNPLFEIFLLSISLDDKFIEYNKDQTNISL